MTSSTMEVIRVLLVEDHQIVRQGLRLLVDSYSDMQVVGEASDGQEAIRLVTELNPDLVVFDISMPNMNGIEFARQVRLMNLPCRLLALTANEDRAYLNELLGIGVLGYLFKRSAATELIEAIRATANNQKFLDSGIDTSMVSEIFSTARPLRRNTDGNISERESEVIRLIAKGFTNKEVAAKLAISVKTIETHKARAMVKLQLRSRAELMRYAVMHHWLDGS